MSRELAAALSLLRGRGPLPLALLLARMTVARVVRMPRGLCVEPSSLCTASCPGCVPGEEATLGPGTLIRWLEAAGPRPATLHLTGRHSDPLASDRLFELVDAGKRMCPMVSISTIGVGLERFGRLPRADRWLVSIPGATRESYGAVRGDPDGLGRVLSAIDRLLSESGSMVEVVLTLWRPSAGDRESFARLARERGWRHTQVVHGLYDPSGLGAGRATMLALQDPSCPYVLEGGEVRLADPPGPCPLGSCLFLGADGTLRPCPFAGEDAASWDEPGRGAWREASRAAGTRRWEACRYCP